MLSLLGIAAIDVSGLSATRTFGAQLVLPDGATLLQPTEARVTVTVVQLAGTRPFLVAVRILNLAADTSGETSPGSVTVVVAGPVPALTGLPEDQVVATVDASGRGPGTYAADVTVRLPSGVTLQSVQPASVTLTIRSIR